MKKIWKNIFGARKSPASKVVVGVSGANAENLDELRQYAESLYHFVCDSCEPISNMMESCGLDALTDDNGNLLPEVDNYPELKKLFLERVNKRKELQKILYTHPELWRPIEDEQALIVLFPCLDRNWRDAQERYLARECCEECQQSVLLLRYMESHRLFV